MSWKSTYGIKRDVAIQVLISSIYRASDEQLEEMLEALPESHFRNYNIKETGYSDEVVINTVEDFYIL